MKDETRNATIRLYEMLRLHQQGFSDLMLSMTAFVNTAKELNPKFAEVYEKQLENLRDGGEHRKNLELISQLDEIIRQLKVN
jgi:hypothetical protein